MLIDHLNLITSDCFDIIFEEKNDLKIYHFWNNFIVFYWICWDGFSLLFQRQDVSEQEEDDTWEHEQIQTEPQSDQDMKPVWITDSKNNIKYAITHVNYSQVRYFCKIIFYLIRFRLYHMVFIVLGGSYINTICLIG